MLDSVLINSAGAASGEGDDEGSVAEAGELTSPDFL